MRSSCLRVGVMKAEKHHSEPGASCAVGNPKERERERVGIKMYICICIYIYIYIYICICIYIHRATAKMAYVG